MSCYITFKPMSSEVEIGSKDDENELLSYQISDALQDGKVVKLKVISFEAA